MPITLGTDVYGASTTPTTTQVENMCKETFDDINAYLDALGYSTPVPTTSTKASSRLKLISRLGAAAMAEEAAFSVGYEGNERAATLRAEYNRRITALKKGEYDLTDATRGTASPRMVNEKAPAAEFHLDADDAETDPLFTRDMVF